MRRARLLIYAVLCAWTPAYGALARAPLPVAPLAAGMPLATGAGLAAGSLRAALSPAPALSALAAPAAPALAAASFAAPSAAAVPAAPAASAAPAAALAATHNGLVRTPDVAAGLTELRAGSYPVHPQVAELVAAIKARRPELPISAENLFLVHDRELLRRLELPEDAAGAARILSDGRSEVPVVIVVAVRGVPLDEFVEFAVHEAVHLMDDGILRVPHDEELKHFFAEGWTQKRAVDKANEILAGLGRPASPGKAYQKEIALVEAFIAKHGADALNELVRTGSDEGVRRALGARWDLTADIARGRGGRRASREKRLNALIALVGAERVGPAEEAQLKDYVGL